MRVARPVVLSSDQQEILESCARARSAPVRSVERARIVLLAGAGLQDQQIAAKLKITPEKAARWRIGFWTAVLRRWTKMLRAREERRLSHQPRCKK